MNNAPTKIKPGQPLPIEISHLIESTQFSENELRIHFNRFIDLSEAKGIIDIHGFHKSMGLIGNVPDSALCDLIFNAFDVNHNGALTFEEYARSLAVMTKGTENEKLEFSFRIMNMDGSGKITYEMFKIMITSIARVMKYMESIIGTNNENISEDDHTIRNLFGQFDKNGDGYFELEDYKQACTKNDNMGIINWMVMDAFQSKDEVTWSSLNDVNKLNAITAVSDKIKELYKSSVRISKQMNDLIHKYDSEETIIHTDKGDIPMRPSQVLVVTPMSARQLNSPSTVNDSNSQIDSQLSRTTQNIHSESRSDQPTSIDTENRPPTVPKRIKIVRQSTRRVNTNSQNTNSKDPQSNASIEGQNNQIKRSKPSHQSQQPNPSQSNKSNDNSIRRSTVNDNLVATNQPNENKTVVKSLVRTINHIKRGGKVQTPQQNSANYSTADSAPNNSVQIAELNRIRCEKASNLVVIKSLAREHLQLMDQIEGLQSALDDLLNENKDSRKRSLSLAGAFVDAMKTRESLTQLLNIQPQESVANDITNRLTSKPNTYAPQKKKGTAVDFGSENWDMVLILMSGIRMSVGRAMSEADRPLSHMDYITKEKLTVVPHGEKTEWCRFIDYAPQVFKKLREKWGISPEEYIKSIGPEQLLAGLLQGDLTSLSELVSEGKSGSFFYFTSDGRYMVKTISHSEHIFFRRMLRDYYSHMITNPETLITQYLGAHQMRFTRHSKLAGKRMYFIVMSNIFNTPYEVNVRYDLKGSSVGRFTKPEDRKDPSVALKDLDLTDSLKVGDSKKKRLMDQIQSDVDFLKMHDVIDYSLLVGIHFMSDGDYAIYKPLYGVPFYQRDCGGVMSSDKKSIYYFGIIDTLIKYDYYKKGERFFKSFVYDRKGISVAPPDTYGERFIKFMSDHIE